MGTYAKKKRRGNASFSSYIGNDYENDPVSLTAAQIVIHAIADWRELVKGKAWLAKYPNRNRNFNELRLFFKGDWCAFLMSGFDVEPSRILEILEKELAEAMQKDQSRKGGGR